MAEIPSNHPHESPSSPNRPKSASPEVEALPPTPEAAARDSDDLDEFLEKENTRQPAQPAFVRPSDEEIRDFERKVKQEFEAAPSVSEFRNFDSLVEEYQNGSEIVKEKLKTVVNNHVGYRAAKKDGNCFFKSFGFRFAELLWTSNDEDWKSLALAKARGAKAVLVGCGYDEGAIEDFCDMFIETLTRNQEKTLLEIYQEYHGDAVVCFLRLCAAAELKKNRELYEAFAEMPLDEFITTNVEPMYIEADNLHIIALVNAFACVNCKIANLDASFGDLNYHDFSPMEAANPEKLPTIELLFRPGHYDVLYPCEKTVEFP